MGILYHTQAINPLFRHLIYAKDRVQNKSFGVVVASLRPAVVLVRYEWNWVAINARRRRCGTSFCSRLSEASECEASQGNALFLLWLEREAVSNWIKTWISDLTIAPLNHIKKSVKLIKSLVFEVYRLQCKIVNARSIFSLWSSVRKRIRRRLISILRYLSGI